MVVALRVTFDNVKMPLDSDGRPVKTGMLDVLDNTERDGHYYVYMDDFGCSRQVSCCDSNTSLPWPENKCYTCCPAMKHAAYGLNHTTIVYRVSPDFKHWVNLGVVFNASAAGMNRMTFRPHVVHNPSTSQYMLWLGVYDLTDPRYLIATSSSPAGPFVISTPHLDFVCGGGNHSDPKIPETVGDFDLLVSGPDLFVVVTHYTFFCIEKLRRGDWAAGTGETRTVEAMDPKIPGGIPGDEAPVFFARGGRFYLMYGSGCCDCKGGSNSWVYSAAQPLGPYTRQGDVGTDPHTGAPVTRAQASAVFRLAPQDETVSTYMWVGNNFVPGDGGEGTCTNHALLYWWPIHFFMNGSVSQFQWLPQVHVNI